MPFKIGLAAVAGLRAATKIVAAFNSLDKTSADYVCGPDNNQDEINSAITAIAATGGTVLLLEGTYYITASITLSSNVALVGQGAGTVLKIPNGFNTDIVVISGSNISHVRVASLRIDGNKANQTAGEMHGICFSGVTFSEITNCRVENMMSLSIHLYFSDNNTITDNMCKGNGGHGIFLWSSSNSFITNNICRENLKQGIRLWITSLYNIIRGNMCKGNGEDGIYIGSQASRTTIAGNISQGNSHNGIFLTHSHHHNVTGNTSQGNGRHGIYIRNSNHNTIVGNSFLENSQSENKGFNNIDLYDAKYNLFASNFCRRGGQTNKAGYGINIYKTSTYESSRNVVHGNDLYDSGSLGDMNDGGYQTLKRDNRNIHGHSWMADT